MIAKSRVDLVVLMPLGPNDPPTDTLESIATFTTANRAIVVVDDTRNPETPQMLRALDPSIHVIQSGEYPGVWGGLWVKLCQGLRYIEEKFDFEVLLKLDADALVIGPNPEYEAIEFVRQNAHVGMMGSYRRNCLGELRDLKGVDDAFNIATSLRGIRSRKQVPVARFLRRAKRKAKPMGYVLGEHCQGGAYFMSSSCVSALYSSGWISERHAKMAACELGEDHVFSLLTKAVGLDLADFALDGQPIGIRWKSLPWSPEELLRRGKKITHSVRVWEDWSEQQIRDYFRDKREAYRLNGQ